MKDEGARRLYVETQRQIYELSKRVTELECGAETFYQIGYKYDEATYPRGTYLSLKNLVYLLLNHWGLEVVHTVAKTELQLRCGAGGPFNPDKEKDNG